MKKVIFILLIALSIALVSAVPSIPNVFSGIITYSNNPSLDLVGTEIAVTVDGNSIGVIGEVQINNQYEVMVDPQDYRGEIIFYIGGVEANPKAVYEMGAFTNLDLTINELPEGDFCGNDLVESGEQCDGINLNQATCETEMGSGWIGVLSCTNSCSFTTSECTTVPEENNDDGGSSGGSGSGGSGSSSNNIYSSSESIEEQTSPRTKSSSGTKSEVETNFFNSKVTLPVDKEDQVVKEEKSFANQITGAFTGLTGGNPFATGALMFALIMAIIVGTIVIRVKSRVKK